MTTTTELDLTTLTPVMLDMLLTGGCAVSDPQATEAALNAEWDRRGGWTRYFSTAQHIHATRACPSCGPRTRMGLRPEFSGRTVQEMIEEFQTGMCTKCFPDAPAVPKEMFPVLKEGQCDGTPAPGQGTRINKKCGKCEFRGKAASWRRVHKRH